jgi:transcriptional regulator with XRE-family HTH domain
MRRMGEHCSASVVGRSPSRRHAAAGSPAKSDLGRAIRELRRERDVSIEALALAADIHPTYLSSIERGRRNPSWRVLSALAGALEISVADLARRVESTERVREGVEQVLADERARLAGVSVGMVRNGAA